MRLRSTILFALLALSAGCASREVPQSYPRSSAASRDAPAAQPASVTHALTADTHAQRGGADGGSTESAPSAPQHEGHHGHH